MYQVVRSLLKSGRSTQLSYNIPDHDLVEAFNRFFVKKTVIGSSMSLAPMAQDYPRAAGSSGLRLDHFAPTTEKGLEILADKAMKSCDLDPIPIFRD